MNRAQVAFAALAGLCLICGTVLAVVGGAVDVSWTLVVAGLAGYLGLGAMILADRR